MNGNSASGIYVDYVFLDTEERKRFAGNYIPPDIKPNECYRVYGNFVILFIEEKVGNVKYSTFKRFNKNNLNAFKYVI